MTRTSHDARGYRGDARVVITGLGVVAPTGDSLSAFWHSLVEAPDRPRTLRRPLSPGHRSLTAFDIAVPDCQSSGPELLVDLGARAVGSAIREAALGSAEIADCGVICASTSIGWTAWEAAYASWRNAEAGTLNSLVMKARHSALIEHLSRTFGFEGPCALGSAACASGIVAVAHAADLIRRRRATRMVICGADTIAEVPLSGFNALRMVSHNGCRPFSRNRDGIILAEGAAAIVLEDAESASRRGVGSPVEISGWGVRSGGDHMTRPSVDGIHSAMSDALDDAGASLECVGFINAHGTGTKINDRVEAAAILRLGGAGHIPPVTAIKSAVGHMQGAAGVFSCLVSALALREGVIPPTWNHLGPDDDATGMLPIVAGASRPLEIQSALTNAFGFGGTYATVLIESPQRRNLRLSTAEIQ